MRIIQKTRSSKKPRTPLGSETSLSSKKPRTNLDQMPRLLPKKPRKILARAWTYRQYKRHQFWVKQNEYHKKELRVCQIEFILPNEGSERQGPKDVNLCDCGLCLLCDGFRATSWAHKFDPLFELPEDLEELDQGSPLEEESDISSMVDPQLVEELERMLNEPSECSDLSDSEDELEERLTEIRTHREQGIQRRLEQWEKERVVEESIQYGISPGIWRQ